MEFASETFTQVLDKYKYDFNSGDIIAGKIFSHEQKGYLVDIGNQKAGYLPHAELSINNQDTPENVFNETREFFILTKNLESKQLVLSVKRLTYIRAWERIKQLKKEDISIKVNVQSINKGGLIVTLEDIQGFIPNSHLGYNYDKTQLLRQSIICKLLMANEHNNKLILSNRCALVEQIMNTTKVGHCMRAQVIDKTTFGVFFDVYGIPALLHKSEIHSRYLQNIDYLFAHNSEWSLKIIHLDSKQGRISVALNDSDKNFQAYESLPSSN
uniref:Ribosomal protein S1 n=1 Tax=Yamadaella caenomyce TaxID=259029 RepID=A0A1G4NYX7_9FLOR|nr:Ribosomal protein S1 [Yamadaella caenomyce]SCW23890.1 Ribosomal protein S1 [Yamadaella caenomyce]